MAGVLRPEGLAAHTVLHRYACVPALEPWVENYWTLRWDLPPGSVHQNQTLPHPACTLSVERGRTRPEVGSDPVVVTGVVTRRFDVTVSGQAWVFAAKFRPGGLAALTGHSARDLRDRVDVAATWFPAAVVTALRELDDATTDRDCVASFDRSLTRLDPGPDPHYTRLLAVIEDMLADRDIVRVGQVAQRHHVSERTLQRIFDHYVGVSPKWVLARYRMHDAVADLDAGYDGHLADLAASLGWYDQAHFTRDFVELVGEPPHRYRARGDGGTGARQRS